MAAPQKMGLDYYPRSTDLLKDRKFVKAKIKYGYLSLIIYDALLEMIYKDKGYYLEYTEDTKEDVVWDILECTRGKYAVEAATVCDVIEMLVECRLFSHDHFKQGIITGKRIQETYYKATVERKNIVVDPNIWMLTVPEMRELSGKSSILSFFVNQPINKVNQSINKDNQPINPQTKVNKTKVNKSKVNNTTLEAYRKYFGELNGKDEVVLCGWTEQGIDERLILEAFNIAISRGKGFNYAVGIVNKWLAEGKTVQPKKIVQTTKFVNYNQPEYTDEEIEAAIRRKKARKEEAK